MLLVKIKYQKSPVTMKKIMGVFLLLAGTATFLALSYTKDAVCGWRDKIGDQTGHQCLCLGKKNSQEVFLNAGGSAVWGMAVWHGQIDYCRGFNLSCSWLAKKYYRLVNSSEAWLCDH